jgi:hypothetical protein
MNKKALFVGAIFLTVAITIVILHNRAAIRILPGSQQIAQTHTAAATAGPKEEAESAWLRSSFAINRSYLAS